MNLRWGPACSLGTIYLLATLSSLATASNVYNIYFPKHIRPGFNISFTAAIIDNPNTVQIYTAFRSMDNSFNVDSTDNVNSGSSARISMNGLPIQYSGSHRFELNITGTDLVTGAQLFFNSSTDFQFEAKSISILIQTDKAIYQPGHTVKFRAIALKPDLKPLQGNVSYTFKDPRNNVVMLEPEVPLNHGVAGGQFSLTKDAVAGMWKVEFIAEGFKESLSVEVKRYKLPKFKVEVKVPSYIHSRSTGLTIKLDAKYTFGKGVQGTGLLEVVGGYQFPVYYGFGGRFAPQQPTRNKMIRRYPNFDGSVELFISTDEINEELGWNGASESIITVTGSVTEALTRETFNDTQRIDAKTTNIKVETLVKPLTIKPGLKYSAYIQVTEVDGKPLPEEDRLANNLLLNIEYRYPRGVPAPGTNTTVSAWYAYRREETRVFVIPPSGIVKVTINAPSDNFVSISFRPYTNSTMSQRWAQQWTAERADSPSNSYLQITTDENSVVPGNMATVTIRTTEAVSEFTILIISRGEILSERKYQTLSGLPENSHFFEFSVEYDMIPGVQVLASYVRNDGEIVADYLKLTVTAELENQVSITSSSTSVDAGEDVSIRVQTSSSGAYVGARAIDQSVLLLKSGNDISQERIVTDLNQYSVGQQFNYMWRWWWWYPTPSGASDASDVFKKAGILVFTDALVYQKPDANISPYRPIALARPFGGFAERNIATAAVDTSTPATPTRTRTLFPETWLWDERISGADGSATFNTTAPDTITSWIFSAFSVSDQHGLGVSEQHKVTVFRNFFITLNLPVKVIRGELIIVQAIVFNYLSTEVEAVLTLTESNKFVLLRPGNNSAAVGFSRRITVPASGSVSVKFPVRMETLGEIPITMTAISEIASDALTRKVFVQPEGIAQCTSGSVLFQRMDASVPPDMESLNIQIPTGIVPGSEKVKLFVYGDILGSTMNNLGSLLRTPSGCGEQNMLGFAPDVFVTLYLHSAGKLDATVRAKAFKHFQTGYSNELNYKHSDGSFSAFGERDASGSTWLTAFVAKCFMFARELRPTLVSTSVIDQALTFLINQQNTSGTFREPGRVSHKAMQGGVDSPITMTAYVLITLKETNYAVKNRAVQEAAENARIYLENHLSSISENKYALAIVTYALHVAGSSRANEALQALEALATVQGGFKFWHDDSELPDSYSSRWRPYYYNPPTNDIEMSAYALLTYVRRNDLNAGIPVMKWLASKRSSLGGYSGTQDTVIAIQALSKVAGLLVGNTQNLQISASHSNNPFTASYNINRENSIVFNSVNVPAVDGTVQVTATGVGVAVAQISVCYNTPSQPYAIEPFQCTNTVVSTASRKAKVNWCCSLRPGDNATGMFLMEVNLPSGYTVDIDNERTRNPSAKLVEIDGNGVNVYYDELAPGRSVCADIELLNLGNVGGSKARKVAASDYYQPKERVEALYQVDEAPVVCDSCSTDDIAVCSVCADCAGCPGPAFTQWSEWSDCAFCGHSTSSRTRDCRSPFSDNLASHVCGGVGYESRVCASVFPCPDTFDGLWFNMPRNFPSSISVPFYAHRCRVVRGSRQITEQIPGIALSGTQHLTCNNYDINPNNNYTFSILVKPNAFRSSGPTTIFSYGMEHNYARAHLEKVWWRSELRFKVRSDTGMREVRGVSSDLLITDQWNHIVVAVPSGDKENIRMFVNGNAVGSTRSFTTRFFGKRGRNQFFLGQNTRGNAWARGYFQGGLAAVGTWRSLLTDQQITALYEAYRPAIESSDPLSVKLLRHFATQQFKQCFQSPATIEALYRRSAAPVSCPTATITPLMPFLPTL
nr:alpha-2-macroglobulin homologue precursor [Ciona intestinalis]